MGKESSILWDVIAETKSKDQDHYKAIVSKLASLSNEEIITFEIELRKAIILADDFKIMAAQKIIDGWVTDDPYLYFRCWLISQGQDVFLKVLKNPDYLAEIVNQYSDTDFENLIYAADEAFILKNGKLKKGQLGPRDIAYKQGLDYDSGAPPTKGKDWEEEDLPKICPNLFRKFQSQNNK